MKISFLKLFVLSSLIVVSGAQANVTICPAAVDAAKDVSSTVWSSAGENVKAIMCNIGAGIANLWSYAPGVAAHITHELKLQTAVLKESPVITLVMLGMTSYCAYRAYQSVTTNNTNTVANLRQRVLAAIGR